MSSGTSPKCQNGLLGLDPNSKKRPPESQMSIIGMWDQIYFLAYLIPNGGTCYPKGRRTSGTLSY